MSSYFINNTETIDDLFEPLQNVTKNPDVKYADNSGSDLSELYAPYIQGTTKAKITNYKVNDQINYPSSPLDLNSIFNKKILLPVGTIIIWTSDAIPSGYLLCNGSSYSTTTYANLFALISYTYGGGGNNFNVPNFTTNNAMPYYDTNNSIIYGHAGGSNNIDLTSNNLPQHTHAQSLTFPSHSHSVDTLNSIGKYYFDLGFVNKQFGNGNAQTIVSGNTANWPTSTDGPSSSAITGQSGTNSNVNNTTISVQNPYLGINYIIKYE
jgi:microcystin-dependent protein